MSLSRTIMENGRAKGLGNKFIAPMNDNAAVSGRVLRRQRRGGVLNFYHREAA